MTCSHYDEDDEHDEHDEHEEHDEHDRTGWISFDEYARRAGVDTERLLNWVPDLSGEGLSQEQRQGLKYKLFFHVMSKSLYGKGRAKDSGAKTPGLDGLTLGNELWMWNLARDKALMYGLEIDLDYTERGDDALHWLLHCVLVEKGEELETPVQLDVDRFEGLVDSLMRDCERQEGLGWI